MMPELIATLADHAQGNPRALMTIAGELLDAAAQREMRHIDEKLFLEMCAALPVPAEGREMAPMSLLPQQTYLDASAEPAYPRPIDRKHYKAHGKHPGA